jgi:multidrug efflux pump subunit AcrA (membrane-fusion protein)
LQLDVDVALVGDQALDARWQGQLEQISAAIDPTRNTLGLLVSVSDPYGNIIPGKRPPLIKGMYVAVTFTAPAIEAMVIPRSALHEGRVYVADEQSQLAIKPVDIDFIDGESVVLLSAQSALQPGDRIITSDVIPLIPGMPLTLSADVEASDTADGATR